MVGYIGDFDSGDARSHPILNRQGIAADLAGDLRSG